MPRTTGCPEKLRSDHSCSEPESNWISCASQLRSPFFSCSEITSFLRNIFFWMPKMEVFYGPGLPYGAREKFPLSKTMATPHRMHCLDRNSSSLLGVRIQSLIRHGSKNPQKPQICRKKWHKNNELGASHSHGFKFPNLSHAQSMNRYPLSCQISSGKMWLKQTNNIKYPCSPTIFHFSHQKKKT